MHTGVSNQALPTVQSFHGRVACRELEPGSSLVGQTLSSPFSEEGEEEIVWKLWQEVYDASWKRGGGGGERDCPERLVWFKANYNTHSLIIEE